MTDGAHTPLTRARPDQPANLTDYAAGPDPASAKACQPPFTHRHAKALEQAGAHHGELIRLRSKPVPDRLLDLIARLGLTTRRTLQ